MLTQVWTVPNFQVAASAMGAFLKNNSECYIIMIAFALTLPDVWGVQS